MKKLLELLVHREVGNSPWWVVTMHDSEDGTPAATSTRMFIWEALHTYLRAKLKRTEKHDA